MEIFSSEKITDRITRITEITGTHMYLAEGTDRAILIDTGCGIGDLKGYVEQLTEKPLTVVCTHGHLDHAGGADQFEQVYLNKADWELTLTHCSLENRKEYTRIMVEMLHPDRTMQEIERSGFQKIRKKPYAELKQGMKFDLGGLTVQPLALKGHTAGSMCMLFCEERAILLGDACNPSVFLFDVEAESVETYRHELEEFQKYEEFYDRVWISHGPGMDIPKEILKQNIQVCDEILTGKDEKVDFQFFLGGTYKSAHRMRSDQTREDGGLANIIYNPCRIFAK